ncbi:MAG TPA: CCA tRNA nucleotidyltransferase [Candidatus Paceibacterota bacterium]|nr:CCA tRNA nucleotidyltransferase [Candidatus Paceibacterota bacterium]
MEQLKGKIPDHILETIEKIQKAGFEAYLVGGCVRDILRDKAPKDWDVTTNALPEQILEIFPDSFYENDYGTVGVIHRRNPVSRETGDFSEDFSRETFQKAVSHGTDVENEIIEVTPYRTETTYSNKRHPDEVHFSSNLEEDLARRDFTVNAIAFDPFHGNMVDPYKGQKDIKDKTLRAVRDAKERFDEDALRMMRAIRLSTELDFAISTETQEGVIHNAGHLAQISHERIRDELVRILMSENPLGGIVMMHQLGLLKYVLPEVEEGIRVEQNGDHIYDVWEHNLRAMAHAAERHWPLHIRLAALLHDVAKPATRRWSDEKKDWTFYGHDVVGGRMAKKILERLKFPKQITENVSKLVRYHMFFTDIDKITLSAVRRLVQSVGKENVWDLMKIRACDRIGMGRPKEKPYRLRKYESMIEEAMRAPVTVGMLKIDGKRVMEITGEKPGPKIGFLLHALLEDVLDDPERNTEGYLNTRAMELSKLPLEELQKLGEKGKEKKEQEEQREIEEIRKRYHVK